MTSIGRAVRSAWARVSLRLNSPNFENTDYLEAYSKRTNLLVDVDPKMAIGGIWDEMGEKQFEFLVKQGLQPHHSLLDIGCGTLRGGQHFIRYLGPEKYWGFDISEKTIEAARMLVLDLQLSAKKPHLGVNAARNLRFEDYRALCFDYLIAQSVFSHLKPEHIRAPLRIPRRPGGRLGKIAAGALAIQNEPHTSCSQVSSTPITDWLS